MNKICSKCSLEKPIECFELLRSKGKERRHSDCRECRKLYFNKIYKERASRKKTVKEHTVNCRIRNLKLMFEYLATHPCVDCGETDPIVLEFDHVRGDKKWNISSRACGASKWETIKEEIDKCDVRCANCHRRRTAKQLNWYRGVI